MPTMLITGAAKRIGRTIALEIATKGWQVAVHHHDSLAESEQLVKTISAAGGTERTVDRPVYSACRRTCGCPHQ
jgi:NAD(P)-dependent dehydrogenase (short-subunit alcohol dehydrogenase family)